MSRIILTGSTIAAAILAAVLLNATIASSATSGGGFLTAAQSYITMVDTNSDSVMPFITAGDTLQNGYKFAKIPDGLGMTKTKEGNVDLFVSHELNNGTNQDGFAKVSKLTLASDASVLSGRYLINGTEGYERFCSGYLAEGHGFSKPVYFANEESAGGVVVAVDQSGGKTEMPWLGMFEHENTIQAQSFWEKAGKIVLLSFEDGPATDSEIYMYVANSESDLFHGKGQLYVLGGNSTYASWNDVYYTNWWVRAHWIPLTWNYATQNATDLNSEATSKGAFKFIRPEDGTMDKRPGLRDRFYLADTGSDTTGAGAPIPVGKNGQTWEKGRIYKFEFTDAVDPTKIKFRVLLDGNDPKAPGYGIMMNPDNLDTSKSSLMILEDPIGITRIASTSPYYDITRNAKILKYDLENDGLEIVGYVNQLVDQAAKHRDWESSGIIDASGAFGKGSWLLDVQAHSIQEGGQLLLMKVKGS